MMVTKILHRFVFREVSNAPLVLFRILFGAMMAGSIIRFAGNGWIEEFYILPQFHFTYYGFDWVRPLSPAGMYVVFAIMFLASMGILLGAYYRISALMFFLTFTYVELLDKTYYLNHYYFVSLVSFLLIWLPAHKRFSLDVRRIPALLQTKTSFININILRLQVGIVYVYAGMAKLNSDWLIRAMPLKLWLPANSHIPLLGYFLKQNWVAYLFSWFGAFYDLTIPFFLLLSRTRIVAFVTVIIFHLLTWLLFPIGIFPFVMIFSALIFFPTETQERWLAFIEGKLKVLNCIGKNDQLSFSRYKILLFTFFITAQLLLPWRYMLYPGSLFWNEEGFRFSWRVMLMEKAGYISFKVKDPLTERTILVDNLAYLNPQQEKMMSTQPDMILQFAHHLNDHYRQSGISNPIITADAYVTLNGRMNKRYIDPQIDLGKQKLSLAHRPWVMEYED